jgi:hypothetical protein
MVAAAIAASAVVGAGASIAASKSASSAAKKSASTSERAAASDRALQWQMYQQQRGDQEKFYGRGRADLTGGFAAAQRVIDPYDNAGPAAANRLAALGGVGGAGAQLAALQGDPGYQFRVQQGTQALDRSAAARGMLLSGAQLKGLSQFNQGLASDELTNAFNRTNTVLNNAQNASNNRSQLYSGQGTALANLATGQASQNQQLGQNTTNALQNISQNNTANQIQAQTALGQARGSAYTGVANAANSAMGNALFHSGMQGGQVPYGTTAINPSAGFGNHIRWR